MENQLTNERTALHGLRILDFTHALAGPYCTLILSEYGAEVYKVESPSGGDIARGWGPPFQGGESSFFLGHNRGKYGVSIDLKRPEGIALCLRLIEKMDVLVENFRPGTMERLGLGYEAARAVNPRLIYCSISGYGQSGPSSEEPAMDLILQATTGLISLTGTEAGEQVRTGYSIADVTAGMFSVIGILTALQYRERTGLGQFVDVSMFDAMISSMSSTFMYFLGSGIEPRPMGTSFATIVPYRCFAASDRNFALAIGSDKLWVTLCEAIERPDLAAHPDYATNARRVANRHVLEPMLADLFRQRPVADWVEKMGALGIPIAPVRTLSEVFHDPQAAARELFPTVEHPRAGQHTVTGAPVKLSSSPGQHRIAAPLIGQHTRDAMRELLHFEEAELDALLADGILHVPA